MWSLGFKDGFKFSAGLFDYVLNWGIATKPWLILIVGPIYFVVYYLLFSFAIKWLNLKTPGREPDPNSMSYRRRPSARMWQAAAYV